MTDQQPYWRYTAGTWEPIDDLVPGDPWDEALENAGFFAGTTAYGRHHEPAFTVYRHNTEDRWLVEIDIIGDCVRLVEVTSFPDLVDLTTKLAPLATAEILTGLATELEDVIDLVREDAERETRRRRTRSS